MSGSTLKNTRPGDCAAKTYLESLLIESNEAERIFAVFDAVTTLVAECVQHKGSYTPTHFAPEYPCI